MADEKTEVIRHDLPIQLDYASICDGAMVKSLQTELEKLLWNIQDINTPATAVRSLSLKLKLKPKEDRCQIGVEFSCSATLAATEPHTSRLFIGRSEEGELFALDRDPRQMNIFTPPAPREVAAPIQFVQAAAAKQ